MGTRRERQRQGQSDQKRPQDPEKDGHSRPAGRRQRQETEIKIGSSGIFRGFLYQDFFALNNFFQTAIYHITDSFLRIV